MSEGGEKAEADQGSSEKFEREAAEEWRQRRIGDIAPGEMAGIVEGGEFIPVETVVNVRQAMKKETAERQKDQDPEVGPKCVRAGTRRWVGRFDDPHGPVEAGL